MKKVYSIVNIYNMYNCPDCLYTSIDLAQKAIETLKKPSNRYEIEEHILYQENDFADEK